MKNNIYLIRKKTILLGLLMLPLFGFSQHFTLTLDNFASTCNTIEVDVMLTVNAPIEGVRLKAFTTGINFNPAILNGGLPCSTTNCGSWAMIEESTAPEIAVEGGLNQWEMCYRANPIGHLRIYQGCYDLSVVDLLPGTYRIGRFRFTNTVSWTPNSDPELWLESESFQGSTATVVGFSPFGQVNPYIPWNPTDINSSNEFAIDLGYTQGSPLHRELNCALATNNIDAYAQIVSAFPNPFSDVFKLNLTKISSETIQIMVYDILGKQIEAFNVEANEANALEIGQSYPSGFYHLKVSQGDKTQSIKMIKR